MELESIRSQRRRLMREDDKPQALYRLTPHDRLAWLVSKGRLSAEEAHCLSSHPWFSLDLVELLTESAVGHFPVPIGVAANFLIDGFERLIPMSTEEPSVIAAANHGAKLLRRCGISTIVPECQVMIGQIQCFVTGAIETVMKKILGKKDALLQELRLCSECSRNGRGAFDLEVSIPESMSGMRPQLIVNLLIDVGEAMGANIVNDLCEAMSELLVRQFSVDVNLRILTNLADRRLASAVGRVALKDLPTNDPRGVAERIEQASLWAEVDPYRAATHNKGVMNGVDAVLLVLGQDLRAVEAGAHAYACRDGRYRALATWRVEQNQLVGRVTLPMAVGAVGGMVGSHRSVAIARKLAGIRSVRDIASVAVSVGLAQNLAALLALVTEGIQRGHMRLHHRRKSLSIV